MVFTFMLSLQIEARCRAILINGGLNPANNFNVHTAQLREMYNALRAQGCSENDIHVFSASGSTTELDFRVDPTSPNSSYVSNPYRFNGSNTVPNLYPADPQTLKTQISRLASQFKPEDKVFIYAADHGANENGRKGLVAWSPERPASSLFTPQDLESALASAPEETRIKLWSECCYCGVFNKMKRANTCVVTSTDEYHEGSYNWMNWGEYARNQMRPVNLSSKTYFAGQLKNETSVSLGAAARVSRSLTAQDQEIQADTIQRGCFVGPTDSAEQYMFDTIGFGQKQLCMPDIFRLTGRYSTDSINSCNERSGFTEVDNLRNFLNQLNEQQGALNYSERNRLQELNARLTALTQNLKNSPEYRQILDIRTQFNRLTPEARVQRAERMQADVAFIRKKLLEKTQYYQTLLSEQKLVIEALFYSRATAEQKAQFLKRKQCVDEALF